MRRLLDLFQSGRTVYVPGATGEVLALAQALQAEPDRMRNVHLVSCLLPGVNGIDYGALDPAGRVTVFLLPSALRPSFEDGRTRVLPLAYSAIALYLETRLPIDVVVAHVAPPDAEGFASFGVASDFTPLVWPKAQKRVAIVNHAMPAMRRGPRLSLKEADLVIELDHPIVEVAPERPDPLADRIAGHGARLVPDGAVIQIGLGGVPGAVWRQLAQHRDLTVASGMVGPGFAGLVESGALRAGGRHQTGVALGDMPLYRFLADEDPIAFATVRETHDVDRLARIDGFIAINSALEVDLFGQCNLEFQGSRLLSGVGGAPDFARGALRSRSGRSIVALPATAKDGRISRIVPRLAGPCVSLGRTETDTIVTEHGIAELRDRSIAERAEALMAIAAPEWREQLAAAWAQVKGSL